SQANDQGAFASHFLSQGGAGINGPESQGKIGGVKIAAVVSDNSPGVRRYDPGHPDADKNGYVTFPDINPLTEMVDLMSATRAYDLNSSAVEATKGMITASLDILK
ncbi:MAG TPA: flagellar basal body rod C-terminal domain-containing protein, partial [Acidobacteriaceae bacterium]|nr:flagellar basal body rod C-terminal domain-containing protein [Acidobacteriaceae bacterium]